MYIYVYVEATKAVPSDEGRGDSRGPEASYIHGLQFKLLKEGTIKDYIGENHRGY